MRNRDISLRFIFLLLSTILFFKCSKYELGPRKYSKIDIHDNIIRNGDGITFSGEIISKGNLEIFEKGFVWSDFEEPTIDSYRIFERGTNNDEIFNQTTKCDFRKGKTYKVRAYVKEDIYLVYSKIIEFESLFDSPNPVITDFFPHMAKRGDTLKIYGQNFSQLQRNSKVNFGELNAPICLCSDTLIVTKVPEGNNSDSVQIKVSIYDSLAISKGKFKYINPFFYDFFPKNGTFYDTITITGSEFPENTYNSKVTIGGISTKIIKILSTQLKVLIPAGVAVSESNISVNISGTNKTFDDKFKLNPPSIKSFSPSEVFQAGSEVTIVGNNFNPSMNYNSVYLGNYKATIIEASSSMIKINVPAEIIPNPDITYYDTLAVKVTTGSQTSIASNKLNFSYLRKWTRARNFPGNARIFGVSFGYQGKGYYGLGSYDEYGTHYSDFWEYNPDKDTWLQKSKLPATARGLAAYFVIGNKLYVCCGTTGNQYQPQTNLSEVWEYNVSADAWTRKNDFPGGPRYHAFGFSMNDKGYVGGGAYGNYTAKYDLWEYDVSNDSWKQKNNIPQVFNHDDINSFSVNGSGYFLGTQNGSPAMTRDFWQYNVSLDNWTKISPMIGPLNEVTGFELNKNLYVGTGLFSDWGGTSSFFCYNPITNNWTSIGFVGQRRRSASSFVIGNYGYIFGGRYNSFEANLTDVWRFDPTKP